MHRLTGREPRLAGGRPAAQVMGGGLGISFLGSDLISAMISGRSPRSCFTSTLGSTLGTSPLNTSSGGGREGLGWWGPGGPGGSYLILSGLKGGSASLLICSGLMGAVGGWGSMPEVEISGGRDKAAATLAG